MIVHHELNNFNFLQVKRLSCTTYLEKKFVYVELILPLSSSAVSSRSILINNNNGLHDIKTSYCDTHQ